MAEDLEKRVWDALKTIKFAGMSRDIVSFGFVNEVKVNAGGVVTVVLQMATQNEQAGGQVKQEIEQKVGGLPGVSAVAVNLHVTRPPVPQEMAQRAIAQDASL